MYSSNCIVDTILGTIISTTMDTVLGTMLGTILVDSCVFHIRISVDQLFMQRVMQMFLYPNMTMM